MSFNSIHLFSQSNCLPNGESYLASRLLSTWLAPSHFWYWPKEKRKNGLKLSNVPMSFTRTTTTTTTTTKPIQLLGQQLKRQKNCSTNLEFFLKSHLKIICVARDTWEKKIRLLRKKELSLKNNTKLCNKEKKRCQIQMWCKKKWVL